MSVPLRFAIGRPLKAFDYIRRYGWIDFAEQLHHRIATWHGERKYGVSTAGYIEAEDLGVPNPDATGYAALGYEHLRQALCEIPFADADVVFLDYGAGKGRAMVCAAARPFRRVLGVELLPELAEIGRQNLARMKYRRAAEVNVFEGDAAEFIVPADANVIFLFNPFVGETLAAVVRRLQESYQSNPRPVFVIAYNHAEFDRCLLRHQWLQKIQENEFRGLYRSV